MQMLDIQYRFFFADGREESIEIKLDRQSLEPCAEEQSRLPEWSRLEFHQCSNCPLTAQTHPFCPLAAKLVKLAAVCNDALSHDEVRIEVTTPERTVTKHTTAQRAISSLMGLIMATSGCPHMEFFKPMARFHLPLATEEETIYRAAATYLLAQYFRHQRGLRPDLELDGLKKIYREIHTLNIAMASRLRAISDKDATVNAMILLDLFAKTLPYSIEDSLEEIGYLFRGCC